MTDQEAAISVLRKILTGSAELPGAACSGHADLFDPRTDNESADRTRRRHAAAAALCRWSCPVQTECRQWVDELPPSRRPRGVIAGITPNEPGRPRTRTPKLKETP